MLSAAGPRFTGADQRQPLRDALSRYGELTPTQTAGRMFAMACVSLEVTQRCNLDCTLCYLSDRAETVKDVPLPVLVSRIKMIESHYGPGTSIQISGGDPTLRKIEDLEALCRTIRAQGMRSCLMTNGIKATRDMLSRLAAAGLDDVAFHVDLTQERAGYPTEESLNAVREAYIARAQGLGLRILFNTTLYKDNIGELAALSAFFRRHATRLALVSFQMQADTGRGVLRQRDSVLSRERVIETLSEGFGLALDFDAVSVGHSACNRYTSVLVAGDSVVSPLSNGPLIGDTIAALSAQDSRAGGNLDIARRAMALARHNPHLALRLLAEGGRWLWRLRHGLWRSRGRIGRMSILIHDFMDAQSLDRGRCESCVFMVATANGPLSMCVHNAERDTHIFAPSRIETADGPQWWNPATGTVGIAAVEMPAPAEMPLKRLKGRLRAREMASRRAGGETR